MVLRSRTVILGFTRDIKLFILADEIGIQCVLVNRELIIEISSRRFEINDASRDDSLQIARIEGRDGHRDRISARETDCLTVSFCISRLLLQ